MPLHPFILPNAYQSTCPSQAFLHGEVNPTHTSSLRKLSSYNQIVKGCQQSLRNSPMYETIRKFVGQVGQRNGALLVSLAGSIQSLVLTGGDDAFSRLAIEDLMRKTSQRCRTR